MKTLAVVLSCFAFGVFAEEQTTMKIYTVNYVDPIEITTGGIVSANERKYRFCFPVIITPTLGK